MSLFASTFNDQEEPGATGRRAPLFDDPEPDGSGTFTNALARGVDSTQAGLFAFAKTLSDAVGVDVASKWAQKGIDANVQEIMANPPELRSWDDVDGFADFGTYVLEALGEQAPQLALQFAGASGAGKLARAALGKAMKRKLGEQAYANYKVQAAVKGSAEAQALAKREAIGATIGAMAVGTAQNTGETKMSLDEAGVEDNSLQALMGGAIKGALDTLSFGKISGLAQKLGVPAAEVPQVLAQQANRVGLTGMGTSLAAQVAKEGITDAALEGVTETAQSFVDQVIVHANKPEGDLFSDSNIAELRESFIKGGILGGVIGSATTIRDKYPAYAKAKKEAEQDADISIANAEPPALPAPAGISHAEIIAAYPPIPADAPQSDFPDAPTMEEGDPTSHQQTPEEEAQILANRQHDEHLAIGLSTLPPLLRQNAIDHIQSGAAMTDGTADYLRNIGRETKRREAQQGIADQIEREGRTTVYKEDMIPAEDLAAHGVEVPTDAPSAADSAFSSQRGLLSETAVERPDPAVMPEPYTKTGLTPTAEIAQAVDKSAGKAEMLQRAAATMAPATQRAVGSNIIEATSPDGKPQQLSLTDLTYAGMNSLGATKTAQELSETEFRVRGLEYALSEMIANGWDVSSAFNERGQLRAELSTTVGNLQRGAVQPNKDIRQAQQERSKRQYASAPDQYMPELPDGAAESVRQDMALQIEDHQNRAMDIIETWAQNPEGDLANLLGATLRRRGEGTHPAVAQLEVAVRNGAYSVANMGGRRRVLVDELLKSPEVSDLLAESESMRENLIRHSSAYPLR